MSTQTVFLHQAIAQGVGLNATDTKCIDLILRGGDDHGQRSDSTAAAAAEVTAGWLAERTGLTSGAITHILDRLERRGFIRRVRDPRDRRKVFVRVRARALAPLVPRYEAIGHAYMRLVESYSDEQLELICDYLVKTSEHSQRQLERIIGENRASHR
jgi:DNA-binding MarR family transcriptional regulator